MSKSARFINRRRKDLVLPDDVYNILLVPIAKRLKITYLPRDSGRLLANIFEAVGDRAEKLQTGKLEKIRDNLARIMGPIGTYLEIAATVIKPLVQIIPPHYLLMVIGIVAIPTLIIPMRIIGFVLQYYAEEYIRIPFVLKPQYEIDDIPSQIMDLMITINKVTKKTITCTYREFYTKLPREQQLGFIYEAPPIVREQMMYIETLLTKYPNLWELPQSAFPTVSVPFASINVWDFLEQTIQLTATFYNGSRKVLPPIMHLLVRAYRNVTEMIQDFMDDISTSAKEKWIDVLWVACTGIFGALIKPPSQWGEDEIE